jgi:plastocyanin
MAALGVVSLAAVTAGCGGDDGGKARTLGARTFSDHGTKDLKGKTEASLEVDSNYFGPTFLSGGPGQKLRLHIENESGALHNFSMRSLGIDQDIPAKGKLEIEVTFPATGVALFFCKYHTAGGMNGELLAGAAAPQAAD